MSDAEKSRLAVMLATFISGADRSISFAGTLESRIDRAFPEDDEWQDLVLALASYRPGGGDYLYNEEHVARLCAKMLMKLEDGRLKPNSE